MKSLPISLITPPTDRALTPGAAEADAQALLRAIVKRWPLGAPRPESRSVSLDEASTRPGAMDGSVVLVMEDSLAGADLYKLLDGLEERLTPALIITRLRARMDLESAGVLTAPDATEPAVLAGMLHALMARQPALESMCAELRAARRFQGGLADQVDKMHEELQLAASVQREFLPPELPHAPGLEFGVLFRPCSYVSGDIYNVARLDERRVGFFVADAVGHGVPAALMTVALSRGLSMIEPSSDSVRIIPPGEAMERLNGALLRGQGPVRRFATAVYGVIDAEDRTVTLAAAGHPAPLRLRPDGAATAVETDGCLLGVFPDAKFEEASFTLDSDEALLIFSDGFELAFPKHGSAAVKGRARPSTLYLDHFARLARARSAAGMAAAIEALGRQLDEQSGSLHQVDDLTALMIAGARKAA